MVFPSFPLIIWLNMTFLNIFVSLRLSTFLPEILFPSAGQLRLTSPQAVLPTPTPGRNFGHIIQKRPTETVVGGETGGRIAL
jgi:hypothetical protein